MGLRKGSAFRRRAMERPTPAFRGGLGGGANPRAGERGVTGRPGSRGCSGSGRAGGRSPHSGREARTGPGVSRALLPVGSVLRPSLPVPPQCPHWHADAPPELARRAHVTQPSEMASALIGQDRRFRRRPLAKSRKARVIRVSRLVRGGCPPASRGPDATRRTRDSRAPQSPRRVAKKKSPEGLLRIRETTG